MATSAVDKFVELEARIVRTVELVKSTRLEKAALDKELAVTRKNVDRLETEIEELKKERDVVKNKVEALLETLSELTEESVV